MPPAGRFMLARKFTLKKFGFDYGFTTDRSINITATEAIPEASGNLPTLNAKFGSEVGRSGALWWCRVQLSRRNNSDVRPARWLFRENSGAGRFRRGRPACLGC